MSIPIDLATIWAFIIAFAVFVYVVMDGFDLGLSPGQGNERGGDDNGSGLGHDRWTPSAGPASGRRCCARPER